MKLDDPEAVHSLAKAICRVVDSRNGDDSDKQAILSEANHRVFGGRHDPRQPYRRLTPRRGGVSQRAWDLAKAAKFKLDQH